MIFIGIDPGLHGAIAWMDSTRAGVFVHDCPLDDQGDYDFRAMALLLTVATMDDRGVVTMEKVHALPSDGKCSAFTFGGGYYAWRALSAAAGMTPALISPQTWKRTMLAGVPNDKAAEAKALKQRFQGHAVCSQLHGPRGGLRDGRVDALFLAEYARLNWRLSSTACVHRHSEEARP